MKKYVKTSVDYNSSDLSLAAGVLMNFLHEYTFSNMSWDLKDKLYDVDYDYEQDDSELSDIIKQVLHSLDKFQSDLRNSLGDAEYFYEE